MSEALYETLYKKPDVRQILVVQHVAHALNSDPGRMSIELDYAVSGKQNAHVSCDIVVPKYLAQLTPEARECLVFLLGTYPQKYSLVLEALLGQDSASLTHSEVSILLKSSQVKALLVEGLMRGHLTSFATNIAESSADITAALSAADFCVPHAFERVLLEHLTPELSYDDAAKLLAVAESLGSDKKMVREMIQTALDVSSSSKSLPIEGLFDDMPTQGSCSV